MYYYTASGKTDRSGSQIHDMLFAYAYCFHKKYTFIGGLIKNNKKDILSLIKLLNFLDKTNSPNLLNLKYNKNKLKLFNSKIYRSIDSKIFTNDFLKNIWSKYKYDKKNKDIFTIAIHIRRGDVTPKLFHKGYNRYIPNKYYLKLIKYIENIFTKLNIQKKLEINIYTESKSYETLDVFKKYHLHIDTSLISVWEQLINSDIFIMSKSSFSFIPALYNKNIVLYYPFWHNKLNHWLNSMNPNFPTYFENTLNKYIEQ